MVSPNSRVDGTVFLAYVITCKATGKQYVGITSKTLRRRWVQHVSSARRMAFNGAICAAIRKHGECNFTMEPICCARSWADVCAIESVLIEQWGTMAPNGYNLCGGGDGRYGFKPSRESVERSASKHRGKPCHDNTRRAASRAHKGKSKSPEQKSKIAASKRGIPRSAETKAKLSLYWENRRKAGAFKTAVAYEHSRKACVRPVHRPQLLSD
jgi:group I intron endonuclease